MPQGTVMKFGIFSDLHMEFEPYLFEPDPDVFYLNAGDTHPKFMFRDYFDKVMGDNYFAVLGNHDFYGSHFPGPMETLHSRTVGDFKIAGATLWTDLRETEWWEFKHYMMDARKIDKITYESYMLCHEVHRDFLFNSDADIWVTHHLPSYKSVHEDYLTSGGNQFFATELSDKILDMRKPPKLIVHGHTHKEFDYMIGETRVICHPRGYPNENSWYRNYLPKIIEL
jgi:predicted phosphodiesterase